MKKKVTDDTLVSVLIEGGLVDQRTILGALAEREGGDSWLADYLVERGIVSREDMTTALDLIGKLRSDPFKAQRARVEIVKLRMRKLGDAHEENERAAIALRRQAKRVSDEVPAIGGLVKVGSGD